MRLGLCSFIILLVAGCASTPTTPSADSSEATSESAEQGTSIPTPKPATAPSSSAKGTVEIDVSDVNGRSLASRLELQDVSDFRKTAFEIAPGLQTIHPGVGAYYAYVYVYDEKVPVMVHAQELSVSEGDTSYVLVNLLEGASGKLTVHDYDLDKDLAIDKVELIVGTDPEDPRSIPGHRPIVFDQRVFSEEDKWYKGELHAVSTYGGGEETVAELVARAEKAGLDFLAITDLNTMEAYYDPGFKSDSVVLIPALAWGTREQGIGLIYGPATEPGMPTTREAAQAECIRIQSQGGVFAIAHPCFSEAPWRWGLGFVNAVQVWNGPWRAAPPLHLSDLSEAEKVRENGKLKRSIAAAAAVSDKTQAAAAAAKRKNVSVSANDQAALFWDYELGRGAVSSPIAGGMIDKRSKPMGAPVTWVKAPNKSLEGILHGLRMGRTFVSSEIGGVEIDFRADALVDNKMDVGVGGAVPLRIEVAFHVTVFNAQGAKVQLLRDGYPVLTQVVDSDRFSFASPQQTEYESSYRVRVIRQPTNPNKGYGPVEVLALSAPIYSADITSELLMTGPVDIDKTWIHLDSEFTKDDIRVPAN